MAISLFLHWVSNGYGTRNDVAICDDNRIIAVFTTGVSDGNTPGMENRPFTKGGTIEEAYAQMKIYNTIPDECVCLCGAYEHDHNTSAACRSASHIERITLANALMQALESNRVGVGRALFNKLQYLKKHNYIPTDW